MRDYYNTHLTKTSDPTTVTIQKLERGMVVKLRYKKDKETKLYLVFVLQPKWPNSADAKLHGLSFGAIAPNQVTEISKMYNEVISNSSKVKKLDIAKIQIGESSKVFYTSEIKNDKNLKAGYRTFDLKKIQSMKAVNYDWGKFDKIPSAADRRLNEQKKLDDEQ
jgi:alpha/beta superfamily hydrolase